MEKIQPGKYVEVTYDLYEITPEGDKLVHQVLADDPEKVVVGVTPGLIEPFEKAITGLQEGDSFEVAVEADNAFGPHEDEQVVHLERELFMVDDKFDESYIKPGAILPMMTADGYRINGVVLDVTPTEVVMDFNHPLAGKDVRFKGKILTVREATAEDIAPAHSCGCGCHGDSCDDGCGCDEHHHCGDDGCGCGH